MEKKSQTRRTNNRKSTLVEVGALWQNQQASGTRYFSGTVDIDNKKVRLLIFKNNYDQKSDRAPDYYIYVDDEFASYFTPSKQATPKSASSKRKAVVDHTSDGIEDIGEEQLL